MEIGFVLIIAFVAAMIATLTGFGSATILTPFVLDIKTAIVLVAFFHFANNISKFALMCKSIDGRLVLVHGIPSLYCHGRRHCHNGRYVPHQHVHRPGCP